MRVAVVGVGAVGSRAARQLASSPEVTDLVVVDRVPRKAEAVVAAIAEPSRVRAAPTGSAWSAGCDVVVLAHPSGDHAELAAAVLAAGAAVVSTADEVGDVVGLLALEATAAAAGRSVTVGAAFAPGLSCLLARHAASRFDEVDEIHVARVGTGGPACAHTHHRGLAGEATDWYDGAWRRRRAGTGRELDWFPDPVGGRDCYRAETVDPMLLVPSFPGVRRVTSRVHANRRDRLTSRLPMLRRPHPEGGIGAIRVEVRGRRGGATDVIVLGALDRPAVAAGAVAALASLAAGRGELRAGAAGLAEAPPLPMLTALAERGVKAAVFEGVVA